MIQGISIAVVGSGYVGLVASACLAEMGHRVICVDNDEVRIRQLREGGVPIHEEYLPELLGRHRANLVEFTTDLRQATQEAQRDFYCSGNAAESHGKRGSVVCGRGSQ